MDILYSITLFVSIAAALVAILAGIAGLVAKEAHLQPGASVRKFLSSQRLMNAALALGVVSLGISVFVHSRWGHGRGTVAPMDLGQLLSEHEAFPTVGAMLLVASIIALYRNRR